MEIFTSTETIVLRGQKAVLAMLYKFQLRLLCLVSDGLGVHFQNTYSIVEFIGNID